MENSKNNMFNNTSAEPTKAGLHSPSAIANYFINRGIKEGNLLVAMQVSKLVYIAHGFSLGLRDQGLASEPVEAWKYGTAFSSLYADIKKHEENKIEKPLCNAFFNLKSKKLEDTEITGSFNEIEDRIMDFVYKMYAQYDGWTLSGITHRKGTPWHEVWHEENGKKNQRSAILDSKIQTYFKAEILSKT